MFEVEIQTAQRHDHTALYNQMYPYLLQHPIENLQKCMFIPDKLLPNQGTDLRFYVVGDSMFCLDSYTRLKKVTS